MTMITDDYIRRVLDRLPPTALRSRVDADLRSSIADRLERGEPMEEIARHLGDPEALADSYLAEQPMAAASFAARAVAKVIDLLVTETLLGLLVILIVLVGFDLTGGLGADYVPVLAAFSIAVSLALFWPAYTAICEYAKGYTLGKYLMHLCVVRESGARISAGQAVVRQLALVGQVFIIDALFALFTEKSQRAFELASKTRVIKAE